MIIQNADVFTEDGCFVKKDIFIEKHVFAHCAEQVTDGKVIDAAGCYAVPGLTDIHFHGCMGYDFSDGTREVIDAMAAYQLSVGVTNIVPATMTFPEETLFAICRTAALYAEEGFHEGRARFRGINMEGPFLSPKKLGAQNPAYVRKPDSALFDRLNEASGGRVKLLDLAPEEEGAIELIRRRCDRCVMSIAHTCADYDTVTRAFNAGASHVTHLYNGMNPFWHRAPGPVGAAADREDVEVELIADGIHCHPAAVRAAFTLFGKERIILISDSMRAAGLADGDYTLGGQDVKVTGKRAVLENGSIAGSVTNLMDCVRTAVLQMRIPLETAIRCAAVNPARCVGIYDECGSITPGKRADVLLLRKENLALEQVIFDGSLV